jgi:hypothetical protein
MTTTWTKNAKEGFVETLDTAAHPIAESTNSTDTVTNYGDDGHVGKDPNETILMQKALPTEDPKATSTPTPTATPSTMDTIKDLQQNFDQKKAFSLYKSAVHSAANSVATSHVQVATAVMTYSDGGDGGGAMTYSDGGDGGGGGGGSTDASDAENAARIAAAKNDLNILSDQVLRWGTIVTSYIVVLNLWYLYCYTNFTVDFRDFIFGPLHYILAPTLNAVEVINYHMLTIRMDSNPMLFGNIPITNEQMRKLWHWRPLVFTILHIVIAGVFVGGSFSKEAAGVFTGSGDTFITMLILILTGYYFFNLCFIKENWINNDMYKIGGGFLVFGAVMLVSGLSAFMFASLMSVVFLTYISGLANFSILAFNGFNPISAWRVAKEIFNDLRGAPVADENPQDFYKKFSNFAFRNIHGFYLFFIVFGGVFSVNMYYCSLFSSSKLKLIAVLTNLACCVFFAPSIITFFRELVTLFRGTPRQAENIVPPESPDNS